MYHIISYLNDHTIHAVSDPLWKWRTWHSYIQSYIIICNILYTYSKFSFILLKHIQNPIVSICFVVTKLSLANLLSRLHTLCQWHGVLFRGIIFQVWKFDICISFFIHFILYYLLTLYDTKRRESYLYCITIKRWK